MSPIFFYLTVSFQFPQFSLSNTPNRCVISSDVIWGVGTTIR